MNAKDREEIIWMLEQALMYVPNEAADNLARKMYAMIAKLGG